MMKNTANNSIPSNKELIQKINNSMPGVSARLFGLGGSKTILVKKSTFVGLQLTRKNKGFEIECSLPSYLSLVVSGILQLDGIFYLLEFLFFSGSKKLKSDMRNFLHQQYPGLST